MEQRSFKKYIERNIRWHILLDCINQLQSLEDKKLTSKDIAKFNDLSAGLILHLKFILQEIDAKEKELKKSV